MHVIEDMIICKCNYESNKQSILCIWFQGDRVFIKHGRIFSGFQLQSEFKYASRITMFIMEIIYLFIFNQVNMFIYNKLYTMIPKQTSFY